MKLRFLLFFVATTGHAGEFGVTNPQEMAIVDDATSPASIATCVSGYYSTKSGSHAIAFQIFETCAEAGYTGAMTWLAYMYKNGRSGTEEPEKSAYWDRRAAEAGDEIGMLNFGIDLLHGYGVDKNEAEGQQWIDKAANAGVKSAVTLRQAGYDLSVVTPDTIYEH
jgi:uncharacterized protein